MDTTFTEKRNFIIRLGKALHKFGTSAYRLEAHLTNVANFLGLDGYFLMTPTALTFVLWEEDDQQESSHVARVKPGELDLGALARTNELVDAFASGELTMTEAVARLDKIANDPPPYSHLTTLLSFGLAGGAFAMLLRTGWSDVLFAFILSLLIYPLVYWAEKSRRVATMLEPLVALTAAFIATGLTGLNPSINVACITLSAIIVYIPGLSLTLGLSELASRDLTSGTARVMDAIMVLFKLFFGAYLGMALGKLVWNVPDYVAPTSIATWILWLGIPILSIGLAVVFKTRPRDIFWGVIAGLIAYGFSLIGSSFLGEGLGPFLGALAVGVYSNLYSRYLRSPATIALLQGIVVLVPGSKAYISLNTIISGQQILINQSMGTHVFLIFMSITAGLIFANVIQPPNRTL